MQLSLNGNWTLTAFSQLPDAPATPDAIEKGGYATFPAVVPGDTILDLQRAGILEEPYYGLNIYKCRKYETYRWMYRRKLFVPAGEGKTVLQFDGLNTYAEIFVNGVSVGKSDNMLIPHTFDVTAALRPGEENDFAVVLSSAMLEARKYDFPVNVATGEHTDEYAVLRMPPSAFGWDILCRLLSAGIWRGVTLETLPDARLTQTYYAVSAVTADGPHPTATLQLRYRFQTADTDLSGYTVRVTGKCGESEFSVSQPARFPSGHREVVISEPMLWWPVGYGAQNLYTVTMELCRDGVVLDSRTERIGLRKAEIEYSAEPGDGAQFLVRVNGTPILCKGSNWVPLDALHSRDADRYDMAIGLFREMGCNILRCWGGNVYEDDSFYDLCDEAGILVWQDFSMACSIYPQDADFARRIETEAEAILRLRRNHPCILLWAGDNEVDEAYCWNGYLGASNRHNAITREVLPRAVRMHDPYRYYLPSSPYIPEGTARYAVPEQHNWGPRAYFKDDFYKHTTARFVSECGYHGCPNRESLEKFLPADELWPIGRGGSWDAHNTDDITFTPRAYNRNGLMADQTAVFCGMVPEELDTFILVSQFSQAEACKFFVERTRIRKWRRTGIIWWNMLDGWPQISDAVVDWYGSRKLAFTWLKRIHTPVCLMLDEVEGWEQRLVLGNDSRQSCEVTWSLSDADTGETLLSGAAHSPANENVTVGSIRAVPGEKRLYILRWTAGGKSYVNHYLTGYPPYTVEDLRRWADIITSLEADA